MQRAFSRQESQPNEDIVRYFIMWLLGVPISVLVLLWAFNIV
jgi:hypothetical protein